MVGKLTPDDIVTASVLAVIMHESPWKTANEQLRTALDVIAGKPIERLEQNQPMFWGDTLEPVILRQAANRLSLTDVDTDIAGAFFHDELPFACSLDGEGIGTKVFTHDPSNGIYVPQGGEVDTRSMGVLEAKNASCPPEDVPAPYRGYWQLHGQMEITKRSWGCIAILYRGNDLRLFLYRAEEQARDQVLDAVHEFERRKRDIDWYQVYTSADGNVAWDRVDNGAPPLDLNDNTDAEHWASVLIQSKAEKKALEQEIDIAEAELKQILGNHEEGSLDIDGSRYYIKWPMRKTRAQPAKTVPAKPEKTVRQKTLTLKEIKS